MWARRTRLAALAAVEDQKAALGRVGRLVGEDDVGPELAGADQGRAAVDSARSVVEGWTWAIWQTGRPLDWSRPWRLTLTVRRWSWGGIAAIGGGRRGRR